jgi:cell wall-associated NlpC family hydrolase
VLDCYTLVRDYYAELGVYLGDYDRKGTLESDADNYLHNLTNEGFVKISIPEKHSLILMCLGYDRPNHAAIYIGDNMILHHASRRLSSRDVYGGYWAKNTYGFYSLLDLKTKV